MGNYFIIIIHFAKIKIIIIKAKVIYFKNYYYFNFENQFN